MIYISIGRDVFANGYLKRWKLRLFGTPISPDMFLRRHRLVGYYVNIDSPSATTGLRYVTSLVLATDLYLKI